MRLKDLVAPAFIGLIAYVIDAAFKGPFGLMILLYSALPGILDALIAYASYAAADHFISPMLGREPYPTDLMLALALGIFSFALVTNYFLAPFRTRAFSIKHYFLSRYAHLKAIIGLVLIVVRPLAYTRHSMGFVHIERAYEASIAVLLFVYVLTPTYEFLLRGRRSKAYKIILGKAEGSLKDAGVEISLQEIGSYNGRVVRLDVKNEEDAEKQYVLVIEAPDRRMPSVIRTRKLKGYGDSDEVYLLINPARIELKRRPLRIYAYDVDGHVREVIPAPDEPPREYELFTSGFSLGSFSLLLLLLVPLAALIIPTLVLKLAELRLTAVSMALTIVVGYATLKLLDRISSRERQRRVVSRLDELTTLFSLVALSTFFLGLIMKSLKLLTLTIVASLMVLIIAVISPLFTPAKVEREEKVLKDRIIALEPRDPDYFEEGLATRAEIIINVDAIKERFGTNAFRIFLYGDDYASPQIIEVEGSGVVSVPIRIVPDGSGERELIVKLGRLRDSSGYVPIDDSDVLMDDSGRAAVFVLRYRSVPAGSAGVPKEIQQISMKAIAFIFSPTLLLNVLNYLGRGTPATLLSVAFGAIGALPVVLYFYYKRGNA